MKIVAEPIEALVWFKNGEEKPEPFKFRIREKDSGTQVVKIDRIMAVEEIKRAGIRSIVYTCRSMIGGEERVYELKYIVQDCRWVLYKI